MRSIWKGRVGFGLVGLDCKLYKAVDQADIGLHLMHATCGGGRIGYLYRCQNCEAVMENRSELKKGYEYTKDQYVVLDEADLKALPLKSLKAIEILGFTQEAPDPRAAEATYYLSPDKGGEKAFALLLAVMERLGVRAIGKLAMREREHLCQITPFDEIMLLQTLCYADEIRPYEEIRPKAVALSDKEMELGESLVRQMAMVFEHRAFQDEYREALERLIEAKVEGREIAVPAEAEVPTGDLVGQLLASMGMK